MPSLTLHIGFSAISYKLDGLEGESLYGYFPYTYIEAFNLSFTRKEFVTAVITRICAHHKIKSSDSKVNYTNGLEQILPQVRSQTLYTPIYLDSWLVVTPDVYSFSVPISFLTEPSLRHYVNYPNITPQTERDQLKRDSFYVNLIPSQSLVGKPILMTGDRMLNDDLVKDKVYLMYFISTLIREPGVYDIYVDNKNKFILANASNLSNFAHFCTIFSNNSDIECLLTSSLDTKQLIEVPRGTFFSVPTDPDNPVSALVKGYSGGAKDFKVNGAQNLVFDTRDKKNWKFEDINLYEGIKA